MFTRICSALIIGFWLVMIGLLLRKEFDPSNSKLREVPVAHVMRLILNHDEPTDLNINNDKLRIGHLRLHAQKHKETKTRTLSFSGHLQFIMPGMERQRIAWDGDLELEKDLSVQKLRLGFTFRDSVTVKSPPYHVDILVSPPNNLLTWTLSSGEVQIDQTHTYTLDEAGMQKALSEMVPDPAVLHMITGQTKTSSALVIRAVQSSLTSHGEKIDTYLVTIQQNGQTLLEFHVSQIGNILLAKTLIGYTLTPDDFVP